MRGDLYYHEKRKDYTVATAIKDMLAVFKKKHGYWPKSVVLCNRDVYDERMLAAIPIPYVLVKYIPSRHFMLIPVINRIPVAFSKERRPV
jgi:hypothetical protein